MSLFLYTCLLAIAGVSWAEIRKLPEDEPRKVIILTIPKSGSHLIEKAVKEITGQAVTMLPYPTLWGIGSGDDLPIDEIIHWTHLYQETNRLKNVDPNKYIRILNIRDPRDLLISQMDWMELSRHWASWTPVCFFEYYATLSPVDQLTFCIDFPAKYDSIKVYLTRTLEWMKDPHVFICRFEDLVGPQGNGDKEAQERTIYQLAAHLGYEIDQMDVERIAENLFGNTETFHKGKIGRWKDIFTEDHKRHFNKIMGKELIDLGYESDFNW